MPEMESLQTFIGGFSTPVCAGKEENIAHNADQPAGTAAMRCRPEGDTHLPFPVPSFLLT